MPDAPAAILTLIKPPQGQRPWRQGPLRNDKVMRVLEALSLMPLIVPREMLGMLR